MSKLKSRVDEILDGINDAATLDAVRRVQAILSEPGDTESLTAYVHRMETFFNDTVKVLNNRLDKHRAEIDDLEHSIDQLGTTPPAFDPVRITRLAARVEQLEANQLRRFTGTQTVPAPQRDTNWFWHDAHNYSRPVSIQDRVVVMTRGSDEIQRPEKAGDWNWGENGYSTIIAWRYAKEGE